MNAFLIYLTREFDVRVKLVQIFQKWAELFFTMSPKKRHHQFNETKLKAFMLLRFKKLVQINYKSEFTNYQSLPIILFTNYYSLFCWHWDYLEVQPTYTLRPNDLIRSMFCGIKLHEKVKHERKRNKNMF